MCEKRGRRSYIGGLEGSLEDSNGVVLSCDIAQVFWPTVIELADTP